MKTKKVEKTKMESPDPETITKLITEVKENWKEKKITIETVHLALKEAMELVERFNCSGEKKKEYVVAITRTLVTDLVENETDKRIILEFIDKKILENTIDLIVQASKGEFNINNKKTQKKIISCTTSCIPILVDIVIRISKAVRNSRRPNTSTSSTVTKVADMEIAPNNPSENMQV
jgi:hypothetical protein